MKLLLILSLSLLTMSFNGIASETHTTIVSPTSEAAEGLDLHAVSELFKDAKNLEAFEKALNDQDNGANNLDLDEDGNVDFIRVVENVAGDTHIIILQVPLGKTEFQDVATIEVEKTGTTSYNFQVRGNEIIYGPDYYFVPVVATIATWSVIRWIYHPHYRPYRSVFAYGVFPRWWTPWQRVTVGVYRTGIGRFVRRATFGFSRIGRVKTVRKVHYAPRTSIRVKKRVVVRRPATGRRVTTVKKVKVGCGKKGRKGKCKKGRKITIR